ncbi:uncharacterized protein LOC131938234 [Physella acuta]|uniref:uncharacterized protein LOC131938234 n=1 Tax=Physella acuta TaxID=109671 RepID=UPI0027DE669F|nr:uncharacterized protein LOC131938234 [Physella acuta]
MCQDIPKMKLIILLILCPFALSGNTTASPGIIVNGRMCHVYGDLDTKYPSATTNQDCFNACASDPKCTGYNFEDGQCSYNYIGMTEKNPVTDTFGFVYCECTQHCTSVTEQESITLSVETSEDCFKACAANPRCMNYGFGDGSCDLSAVKGDPQDTVTNQNSHGKVYCDCDATTAAPATTAPATTTQAVTTTSQPATTTRSATTTNNQQTTNPATTTNNQEATTRNNQEATTRNNQEATPTTRAPAQRYYDCHSCTSGCSSKKQNYLCPANGKIKTGTNTRYVRCKGPCMSTVNKTPFGGDVVRGCSDGKFPGLRIPANGCLTHKKDVTCFCTGDRCNTRNMVQEQSRMGYGWWMGRGQH